jgi:hypothetical protein
MTASTRPTTSATPSRGALRSIGALVAGFLSTAILSLFVDQILHWMGVFPPWGQVTYATGPFALAVTYRTIFGVVGAWIAARLAPRAPLTHAMVLGTFGFVVTLASVLVPSVRNLGPVWYPIALTVLALPTAWLGGTLYVRNAARR